MKKNIFLIALCLTFSCFAANVSWSSAVDGDFLDSTKWSSQTVPGKSDIVYFDKAGTYTITATGNIYARHARIANGADVTWDLAPYTWAMTNYTHSNIYISNSGSTPSKLTIASGIITNFYAFQMGGTVGRNTAIIKNEGTYISTRSDDYYIGHTHGYNLFMVTNGAYVRADRTFRVGVNSGSVSNKVIVTGKGTRLNIAGGNERYLGENSSHNTMIVENYAACTNYNKNFNLSRISGSKYNSLIVRNGGVFYSGAQVLIGAAGSYNKCLVTNENSLLRGTYVTIGNDSTSKYNQMEVNSGAKVSFDGHLFVGNAGSYNKLFVRGAGTTISGSKYDFNVGARNGANYNYAEVSDGATVSIKRGIKVGADNDEDRGGSYNKLVVTGEGSLVTVPESEGYTYVGRTGSFNEMVVTNRGKVNVTLSRQNDVFYVGYYSGSNSNKVTVTDGGMLTGSVGMYIGHAGSFNKLVITNATADLTQEIAHVLKLGTSSGTSNSIHVCKGGKLLVNQNIQFGAAKTAKYPYAVISGEGAVISNYLYDVYVGLNASNTCVTVSDGGKLYATRNLYIGGDSATNSMLVVDNATAETPGTTYLKRKSKIVFSGSDALYKTGTFSGYAGSTLEFNLDETGLGAFNATTPIMEEGFKLVINAKKYAAKGGGTVTLVTHGGNATFNFSDTEDVTFDIPGCTIIRDAKALKVDIPNLSGTLLMLR